MADWPRTIMPNGQTVPDFPGHLSSWGHSGKGQQRDMIAAGRRWEEIYPVLEYDNADVRAFMVTINEYWRTGNSFDIENYLNNTRLGSGAGTPLIDGAAETGTAIDTKGWTASQSGVLLKGDIVKVVGVPYILDVTADVDSDGAGDAVMNVSPGVWSPPSDGAAITTTGVKYTCVLAQQPDMPQGGKGKYIGGLRLVFREVLA